MILDYFCEDDDDACRRSFLCNDITGWKSSLKHEHNKSGKGLKRIKMLSGMNYSVMIMWLNIGRGFNHNLNGNKYNICNNIKTIP